MEYGNLGTTDLKVSRVSLGGATFSNIYRECKEDQSIELIRNSLNRGVNYIETGPWYGQGSSECIIGKALSGVPRSAYYIASKVGRYEKDVLNMFDFSYERTLASVDTTLERLGLEFVDLIQVHDFAFSEDPTIILKETLPALQKAVSDGKARYIGLAEYDIDLMKEMVDETEIKISTILSYAKCTLYDNSLANYVSFFKDKGIGVINAAATGMGLLTTKGPQQWHPARSDLKEKCRMAAEYCSSQNVKLEKLATWYSINQPGIDTNVCGIFTLGQLDETIGLLGAELNHHEQNVLKHVQDKFFAERPYNWDNIEIEDYRSKITKLKHQN